MKVFAVRPLLPIVEGNLIKGFRKQSGAGQEGLIYDGLLTEQ